MIWKGRERKRKSSWGNKKRKKKKRKEKSNKEESSSSQLKLRDLLKQVNHFQWVVGKLNLLSQSSKEMGMVILGILLRKKLKMSSKKMLHNITNKYPTKKKWNRIKTKVRIVLPKINLKHILNLHFWWDQIRRKKFKKIFNKINYWTKTNQLQLLKLKI